MATETLKTWTAEEIADLFCKDHNEADAATREATSGPFNPYGDAFESLVWHGTIEDAWKDDRIEDWREGASPAFDLGWDDRQAEIERAAIDQARTVVGTGRPIYIAFYDGQFPAVFCEQATQDVVQEAVESFYGD